MASSEEVTWLDTPRRNTLCEIRFPTRKRRSTNLPRWTACSLNDRSRSDLQRKHHKDDHWRLRQRVHKRGPNRGLPSRPPRSSRSGDLRCDRSLLAHASRHRPVSLHRCLGHHPVRPKPNPCVPLDLVVPLAAEVLPDRSLCDCLSARSGDFRALLHRRVRSVDRRCRPSTPYPSMGFDPLRGPFLSLLFQLGA
jgi:hypothetical protein